MKQVNQVKSESKTRKCSYAVYLNLILNQVQRQGVAQVWDGKGGQV